MIDRESERDRERSIATQRYLQKLCERKKDKQGETDRQRDRPTKSEYVCDRDGDIGQI